MVAHVTDAIHHRVAQPHVLVLHVDPGAQASGTIGELSLTHPGQQVQGLLGRTIPERALDARLAESAALRRDRLRILVVDVGLALLDEEERPLVELLEVVGGMDDPAGGVAQPGDVVADGLDELGILGTGVGVVQTKVAHSVEIFGDAEISDDRLGVPDVQIAIGFGWEPGLDLAAVGVGCKVCTDNFANEIRSGRLCHAPNPTGKRHASA